MNYLLPYLLHFTQGLHRNCNNICSISRTESHCHLNEVTHSSEAVFIVIHGKNNVQLQRTIYQCVVKRDSAGFGSRRVSLTMKNTYGFFHLIFTRTKHRNTLFLLITRNKFCIFFAFDRKTGQYYIKIVI